MSSVKKVQQQHTLTDFFAAKKSTRVPAKQALEKLRSLHADLAEIKSKRQSRATQQPKQKSPAFERYANLLTPKLDDVEKVAEKKNVEQSASAVQPKASCVGKNALSRLEAKKAALRAAKEKLRQVQKDQTALKEFQETKKPVERIDVPAYEKYSYLAVPSEKLPLPLHYEKLMSSFSACDTIVSMFNNRKEICRLDKLSMAVRKMTRNNFGISELGKILTLKPDAYVVAVEEHRFLDTTEKLHHIVSFADKSPNLGPRFLLLRKNEFRDKLLHRAAQYHQEFLDNDMQGPEVPIEAMKRWHPKFKLDSVPDIIAKELPVLRVKKEITNAKDVLDKVRGKFSERIEKALESLAEKQETERRSKEAKSSKTTVSETTKNINGVSQSLLERIKRKEALKMAEKMVIGSEDAKEQRQLAALPGLIRTIRQVFLSWQKAAIPYADLKAKIMDAGTYDDLDSMLSRVADIAPEWYKSLVVRNMNYVKIDRNKDINALCSRVEAMIKGNGSRKGL